MTIIRPQVKYGSVTGARGPISEDGWTSGFNVDFALFGVDVMVAILLAPEISGFVPGWIWFLRVLWWSAAGTAILATLIYIRDGSRYIDDYERNLDKSTSRES